MRKYLRPLALILSILMLFSFAYVGAESAHHECQGENCPTCDLLQVAGSLFALASILLIALFRGSISSFDTEENENKIFSFDSLVSLKVKLSD